MVCGKPCGETISTYSIIRRDTQWHLRVCTGSGPLLAPFFLDSHSASARLLKDTVVTVASEEVHVDSAALALDEIGKLLLRMVVNIACDDSHITSLSQHQVNADGLGS